MTLHVFSCSTSELCAEKSRAPSYFSQYFKAQLDQAEQNNITGDDASFPIKPLYIDRDPLVFRDISRHLQGYHISAQDSVHYVKLFADAQFYQCKLNLGLRKILY
jgi:hypothetical protein